MEPYIKLRDESNAELALVVRDMAKKREDDVADYNELPQQFGQGRKVGKIPTSSSDVVASDNLGDFNFDANFYYLLVPVGASAVWRRIALSSF